MSYNPTQSIDWVFSRKHLMAMSWWNASSIVRDSFGIILDGAVRSGKTLPGSCSFVLWAFYRFPTGGKNFFFAGKSIGTVRRNVIKPLVQAARYLGLAMQERRSDSLLIVTNGAGYSHSFYLFGGNDESSKDLIQGFTGAGGFFDEVPLLPRSFVDQALSRLSISGATAWFTCNPDSPTHWFKKDFIDTRQDKDLLYLHMTMDDNLSLSDEVRQRYKSLFSGVFYRRNILGEWCLAEGLVYSMFDADKMVVEPSPVEHYGEWIIGTDYGVQNPQVYLLFGYNNVADRWEVYSEYYHDGRTSGQKTDAEYYADLESFVGDIPATYDYIDPSASSFIAAVRQGKRFRTVHADNSVVSGIQFTSSLFQAGKLVVCRGCDNLLRELTLYSWDAETSRKQGKDIVVKDNDHACDALRYACFTHIRRFAKRYGIFISDLFDREVV